jgi:hypothetical protein
MYRPHTVTPEGLAGVCAADPASDYLARKQSAEQTLRDRLTDGASGCDDLARVLQILAEQQRLQAELVRTVTNLTVSGEAEQVTQLPLPTWLSMVGRLTRRESNLLLNGVDVLADMPHVWSALQAGEVAWGQITVLIGRLRGIRSDVRRKVDDALLEFLQPQTAWEPDELVNRIDRLIDAATPDREQADADDTHDRQFLHIQPDLFGHAGRLYGEAPTETLARMADHLDHIADRLNEDLPESARSRLGDRPDGRRTAESMARRRGKALSAWVFNPALGCSGDHQDGQGPRRWICGWSRPWTVCWAGTTPPPNCSPP